MSNKDLGSVHDASDGGIAAKYASKGSLEILVAPSTASELNTARLRLIPVACWRVDDIRFDFNSSFVTPEITKELKLIVTLREAHKAAGIVTRQSTYPPLSVFGHADPVGTDDYNKALSGRRATVIYALLISNAEPAKAVQLWQQVASAESWGINQRQAMQTVTSLPEGTPDKRLFASYMQKICPSELQLSSKDFLAQGADSGGKGDYQGCSELNPLLIFSQQEQTSFDQADDKTERNSANAPNRRVVVLLFRPGSRILASKWPCPRATDGKAGCIERFWSDGEKRRSTHLPNMQRTFGDTHDTFACRFYQRLADSSPCERKLASFRIRIFDTLGRPVPNAPYHASEGVPLDGTALADGTVVLNNVAVPSTCTIAWRHPKISSAETAESETDTETFEYSMSVYIDADGPHLQSSSAVSSESLNEKQLTAQRRLHNLGFSMGDSLADNIRFFQREFGALETGQLSDIENVLNQRHAACDPPSRYKGLEGVVLPAAPPSPAVPVHPDPVPDADPLPEGEF